MIFKILGLIRSRLGGHNPLTENVTAGPGLRFGVGSFVWAPRELSMGRNVSLGSNVRIEVDGVIGDAVLIANSVGIVGRNDHEISRVGVAIRDGNWVGRFPKELSHPVTIGSDVWIGYAATVLSGVIIGDSSVIGAGSVVTKDVPANSIAVGNPARVVGQRFDAASFERHWEILSSNGLRRVAL
jgi:acetyltransferase-like isoleucine patch superfamily enzyme